MTSPNEVSSSTSEESNRSLEPVPTRFLARQPILDVRREVVAYELLFRSGWENCFSGETDDATRQTLDNCVYLGLESFVDDKLAFVNCTREALVGRLATLLPPKTAVLEILETVEPDAELVKSCIALRKMGYRFALDDFLPRPEMQPLIEIASYIKVDFRLSDAANRKQIYGLMGHSEAMLLAEKVEAQSEFDIALSEGYKLFQGYFFCRPKVIANREIPPNRMNYLRLMIELTRDPLDLHKITGIVEIEPSLSYRLLRMANSAIWGVENIVTSVSEAFMLVGEDRFRALMSVAASCALGQGQSPALVNLSLERARFCQLLAPWAKEDPSEQFMLGLMSLLDAMLQTPMEAITKALPLRLDAKAALLGATNSAAVPLHTFRMIERGDWAACEGAAKRLGITEEAMAQLYLESTQWASGVFASGH